MNAAQLLDARMKAALRQSIEDARAKGQKARAKALAARLAEVEAAAQEWTEAELREAWGR